MMPMKRRSFLTSMGAATGVLLMNEDAMAYVSCKQEISKPGLRGESQGFFEIRHQHEFVIPLGALVSPPAEGYSARSSTPLKGRTDFEGLKNRTDSAGRPLDLRQHAHTVTLTQEELASLAQGRWVIVKLEKFGHEFYFVADDATLAILKRTVHG